MKAKYNVLALQEGITYFPSGSLDVIHKINNVFTLKAWLFLRSKYSSFAQGAFKNGYDNTLTCYSGTTQELVDFLGCNEKTAKKALKDLKDLGLVVTLPFYSRGPDNTVVRRKNTVALDWALRDYEGILKGCGDKLEEYLEDKRQDRVKDIRKSLQVINNLPKREFVYVASKKLIIPEKKIEPVYEEVKTFTPRLSDHMQELIDLEFDPYGY